eukprot:5083364-Pleurochrysis_carterae.AAC.1
MIIPFVETKTSRGGVAGEQSQDGRRAERHRHCNLNTDILGSELRHRSTLARIKNARMTKHVFGEPLPTCFTRFDTFSGGAERFSTENLRPQKRAEGFPRDKFYTR